VFDDPDELHRAADAHQSQGRLEAAIEAYRRALRAGPRLATLNNLAVALKRVGRPAEALAAFRQAAGLGSAPPSVLNNLGNLARQTGDLDEALAAYEQSLKLRPDDPDTLNNYAGALLDARRFDEAVAACRIAAAGHPAHPAADGLLYAMHFLPQTSAEALAEAHNAWGDSLAAPADARPFESDRSPDRPLRVGLVSPNFDFHAVGRFLLPLVDQVDRGRIAFYCYSDTPRPDGLTDRFRRAAAGWRDTLGLDDAALAEQIRADRIDVLIDLALHLSGNRLEVFARRPAPVQATYLAYCSTSGLAAMDYRLTDPRLEPPGEALPFREKPMPLRHSYWCYPPPDEAPPIAPPPCMKNGYVTFGCLNAFRKVSPLTLAAWCGVLLAVPHSRLIVHAHEGAHRQRFREAVAARGVDPQRVTFQQFRSFADYLASYGDIDIALDTLPVSGGTTTCDALWMGVPVITLAGDLPTGRSGVSILNNVGLHRFVARDVGEFVQIAAALARDRNPLAHVRSELRERLSRSRVMDAPAFARDFEDVIRTMWEEQIR